jgi:hypothetical protein
MTDITEVYLKERQYQKQIFGEYEDDTTLSFSSFLVFIEEYVKKAKKAYSGKWEKDLPPWMNSCKEHESNGYAPVKAYEELIKVFALAGAALETYTDLNAEHWRQNASHDVEKWRDK